MISTTRLVLAALLSFCGSDLVAETYLVTNANDSGPGSLRQAILEANANPGRDTITTASGGVTPLQLSLATPLPSVSDPTFLNLGIVEIDGSGLPEGAPVLHLNADDSAVAARIRRVRGSAILVEGSRNRVTNNDIEGARKGVEVRGGRANVIHTNFVGSLPDWPVEIAFDIEGTAHTIGYRECPILCYEYPNYVTGAITAARVIGDGHVWDGNFFSEISGDAVIVRGADARTAPYGTLLLTDVGGRGAVVLGGSWNIDVSCSNCAGMLLDNGGDGPDPNDLLDSDAGPNDRQNHPVIDAALGAEISGLKLVSGKLSTTPSTSAKVQVVDCSGNSYYWWEARETTVVTDSAGNGRFELVARGRSFAAIAAVDGKRSELSPCVPSTVVPVQLTAQLTGPAQASRGETISMRMRVTNAGSEPAPAFVRFDLWDFSSQSCDLCSGMIEPGETRESISTGRIESWRKDGPMVIRGRVEGIGEFTHTIMISGNSAEIPTLSSWTLALLGASLAMAALLKIR